MGGGNQFRAVAVAMLLTATTAACGSAGGDDASDAAATSAATASNEASSGGPDTETFDSPTPEGTDLEPPQSPVAGKVVVHLAGPQVGGQGGDYSVDQPAGCAVFQIVPALNEDVRVRDVSITPGSGFVRDDSGCEQTTCHGFVYPKGESSTCLLGIRWQAASGVSKGTASLTLRGLCRDRDDELCIQLKQPPPQTGVTVEFQIAMRLEPTLPEEPEPPSDEASPDEPPSDTPPSEEPPSTDATSGASPASFSRRESG
jgi:hypothetical protein